MRHISHTLVNRNVAFDPYDRYDPYDPRKRGKNSKIQVVYRIAFTFVVYLKPTVCQYSFTMFFYGFSRPGRISLRSSIPRLKNGCREEREYLKNCSRPSRREKRSPGFIAPLWVNLNREGR